VVQVVRRAEEAEREQSNAQRDADLHAKAEAQAAEQQKATAEREAAERERQAKADVVREDAAAAGLEQEARRAEQRADQIDPEENS